MARKNQSTTETTPAKSRPLKPKPYTVITPDGVKVIVYALTTAGAVARVKAELKPVEQWSAELATGEEMFNAATNGTRIIGAPESLNYDGGVNDDQQSLDV